MRDAINIHYDNVHGRPRILEREFMRRTFQRLSGDDVLVWWSHFPDMLSPWWITMRRATERIVRPIEDMLRRWASAARTRIAYKPGGPGYLEARRDFMVRAGQSRGTRSFRPY